MTVPATEASFLPTVFETLTFRGGYNTNTVIAGTTLLGLAAGIAGVFGLLRKRSLMTDALSHATLPGIALAFILAAQLGLNGRTLPVLLIGAAVTGVLAILSIQVILRTSRLHEDAAIGIVLSVFFGAGIVGLSYIQTNVASGSAGLNSFIYGQAAAMSVPEATLMGLIAVAALLLTAALRKEFALVCFNDAFARVDGWPVSIIDLMMMSLVVLVTIAGLQAVGLLLIIAMLIIPPVAARFWTNRLVVLIGLSGVLGGTAGYLGAVTSALFPRYPAGAVIVLVAGMIFIVSLVIAPQRGVLAVVWRQFLTRLRIASEHMLEAAYERDSVTTTIAREAFVPLGERRGWPAWFHAFIQWTLVRRRLLRREGDRFVLTPLGRARGRRISRNHALWEAYLVQYAEVAPSHVDWSVDQVEHVLSDEQIAALEAVLDGDAGGDAASMRVTTS